jgi:hypothetical protein
VILGCAMPEAEHCLASRRAPGRNLGDDHQPLLLLRLAGHCYGRRTHYGGRG